MTDPNCKECDGEADRERDDYDDLDSVLFEQGTAKGRRNEKEDEDSHKRLVDDMDSIFRNIWLMMNDEI